MNAEGPRAGHTELRDPGSAAGICRSPDTLEDRDSVTGDGETRQVERHGEDDAVERVHHVSGREILAIAAAGNERLSFTGLQRLHDDLGLVPGIGRGIGPGSHGEGEQHPLAAGQHLRAVHHLTVLDADEHVRLAAIRRDAHDAFAGLIEDDPAGVPVHPPDI